MFGGAPAKKAENFWPSFKRLLGLLKPQWVGMVFVTLLTVVSVVLIVIAPKILGSATDVIFQGFIGSQLPPGVPVSQVVEQLREAGVLVDPADLAGLLEGHHDEPYDGEDRRATPLATPGSDGSGDDLPPRTRAGSAG